MKIDQLAATFGHEAVRDFEAAARLFAHHNPECLKLSVAENVLLFPDLKTGVKELPELTSKDLEYADSFGTEALRENSVAMLTATLPLGSPNLTKDLVSGFSSTRSTLAWSIRPLVAGRPNPTFLVPTPCWQGFRWVLEDFLGGRIEPVATNSRDNFELCLDMIRQCYLRSISERGYEPTALVLTNPGNPIGRIYSPSLLEEIADWLLTETGMHLVSDEIYAHAQTPDPSNHFVSALALRRAQQREFWSRVHVAWGFAKDFGLSGFRIGLYLCRDEESHRVVRGTAQWSPFDSYNSATLACILGKQGERGACLMGNFRSRLAEQFEAVSQALKDEKIPFVKSAAALFFFLDLRHWLSLVPDETALAESLAEPELLSMGPTDSREAALRKYLADKAHVDLAPGTQFLFAEPGYFRLCYTAAEQAAVVAGIRRIGQALRKLELHKLEPPKSEH